MKVRVQCSTCPRAVWRCASRLKANYSYRSAVRCKKCKLARDGKKKRNRRSYQQAWREKNRAHIRAVDAAWREANRARLRRKNRIWKREKKAEARALLAEIPCMDCGMKHTPERRAAILRRMLPTTAHAVREAWPCIWSEPWEIKSAGELRLYRDLRALGATHRGRTFYAPSEARSAA